MKRNGGNRPRGFIGLCTLLALSSGCASAGMSQTAARAAVATDSSMYRGLQYRNVGPDRGGRSIGAAGSDSRPLEYYFGAAGGGLWKTTDGGTTWNPVTDGKINSASVGTVAVCETNPDVVYIGTGETQLRGNIQPGDGLYKSTDAGKTWTHIGLKEARNFSARSRAPHRLQHGVRRCLRPLRRSELRARRVPLDRRGASWTKVLYRDEQSGAVDISIHPENPNIVYAALWEAWRKPWAMSSGGKGSGLFKSTDGGTNWTEITRNTGLPQDSVIGKIGVSVSPVDANRVYAIIEADSGGVFRSDDAGQTWTLVNDERKLRQRAFYYTRVFADPQDKEVVYVLNTGFYKSTDGGKTFPDSLRSDVPHGDNHDLWIAPSNNQRMINANDGGGNVSVNGGETWTEQDYATAQIYRLEITDHEPYHLCGGQQDNSTVCVPSSGWDFLSARGGGDHFYAVGGCESGYVAQDPRNLDLYYAGCYGGSLSRYNHSNGQGQLVSVWPENPMGYSAVDIRERIQWTFPIVFSPTDPSVLYTTSQHVFRSTDGGMSWERISPDLTRAMPETMGPSGGPITRDQTGVETYATIFAFQPSPHDGQVMWAGSDDGLLHITRDGGANWQNVTPPELPELSKITTIDVSPHRPGTAYISANRFLMDDFAPYMFRTNDYGQSWTRITSGLPADEIVRSIREDKVRPELLFAGTERGVWASWDNGASWRHLQQNLPVVQVADLQTTERDLAIATHGRSFWVLPGIGPLREMTPQELATKQIHLFKPQPTVPGVDQGVAVSYYLQRPAKQVKLEFLDGEGNVVRSYTAEAQADSAAAESPGEEAEEGPRQRGSRGPSAKAGMNRFVWDLRGEGFTDFPEMIMWAARNAGPMVVPGEYRVQLTVDGTTQTQPFTVRMDPRVEGVQVADMRKRYELASRIRDKVTEANEAVLLIRGVNQQVDSVLAKTQDAQVRQSAQQLKNQLASVEGEVYQVRNRSNQDPLNYPIKLNNKIAALGGVVESAIGAPTAQSYEVFDYLSEQLQQQLTKMNQVLDQQLPALNQQLRANNMEPITRTPLDTSRRTATQR